jgi:hypothetical protein
VRLLVCGLQVPEPEAAAFLRAAQPPGDGLLAVGHTRDYLPLPPSSFLGRERELEVIRR